MYDRLYTLCIYLSGFEVGVTNKFLGQLVAVCEPAAEDLREDFERVRGHHRRVGHVETLRGQNKSMREKYESVGYVKRENDQGGCKVRQAMTNSCPEWDFIRES